jgi:uncharacterized protein YkwD
MFCSRLPRAVLGATVIAAIVSSAFAVGLLPRTQTGAAAGDCTADASLDSEEQALLTLINNYRQQNGRQPLAASYLLSKAAQWKSHDMGVNRYFAHDDLSRTWVQRIRDCGYGYNAWLGENIAAGYQTAQTVFEGWRNSPGHNANMLGGNYTAIGIGRAAVSGSPYGVYWTTEFSSVLDPWPGATPVSTATRTPTRTPTRTNTPAPSGPTATPTPPPDTTPPTAAISSPSFGADVSGTVTITAAASDAGGISKVRFWAGSTYLGYDVTAPYSRSWNTAGLQNGRYILKIESFDNAGNSKLHSVTVTLKNADTTEPSVSITSPLNGTTIAGIVPVNVTASDNLGVQKVRFWVDGTYFGFDALPPYSRPIETTLLPNGTHIIRVQAVDWLENVRDVTITVNVDN